MDEQERKRIARTIADELAQEHGIEAEDCHRPRNYRYGATFKYALAPDDKYRIQLVVATRKEIDDGDRRLRDKASVVLREWKELLEKSLPKNDINTGS